MLLSLIFWNTVLKKQSIQKVLTRIIGHNFFASHLKLTRKPNGAFFSRIAEISQSSTQEKTVVK